MPHDPTPLGPRVLVVDDDEAIRTLLVDLLSDEGYDVVQAVNGADGVQRALADGPAAVLMDLMMPIMSGAEATATLKSDPRTAHIPVLAMSAGRTLDLLGETVQADRFIAKPFDLSQVLDAVAGAITASAE